MSTNHLGEYFLFPHIGVIPIQFVGEGQPILSAKHSYSLRQVTGRLIFEFGLLNSSARDTNATGANTGPVLRVPSSLKEVNTGITVGMTNEFCYNMFDSFYTPRILDGTKTQGGHRCKTFRPTLVGLSRAPVNLETNQPHTLEVPAIHRKANYLCGK